MCDEFEQQQLLVAFVLPSRGVISAIFYTLCGLCQNKTTRPQEKCTTNQQKLQSQTLIRQELCKTLA